jgi:hypothetical protein
MRNNYAALEAGWVPGHSEAFKKNAVGKIQLYDMGGGGDGPQESTTYTTNLPEYAEPYYTRMVERGEALSQEGYQPYDAQRIAGFTPSQQQTFQETLGMQTPGELDQASGLTGIASVGALGAGQFAPEQFGTAQMQQYMSPFQQGVTDIARRQAAEDARRIQQQANLGSATARQGTYGGARQLLAQTEREKGLLQTLGDIQMKGSQSAFENAQMQFERDQARRMGAQELGLKGFQTALQGAGQMAQIGKDIQTTDLSRLQAQQSVANAEQQMEQRRLDQAYQDFIAQREYPYRQLEFYNAMLRGLPVQANTTSTQYNAQPNIAQQVLGYGIPALALSKAFSAT